MRVAARHVPYAVKIRLRFWLPPQNARQRRTLAHYPEAFRAGDWGAALDTSADQVLFSAASWTHSPAVHACSRLPLCAVLEACRHRIRGVNNWVPASRPSPQRHGGESTRRNSGGTCGHVLPRTDGLDFSLETRGRRERHSYAPARAGAAEPSRLVATKPTGPGGHGTQGRTGQFWRRGKAAARSARVHHWVGKRPLSEEREGRSEPISWERDLWESELCNRQQESPLFSQGGRKRAGRRGSRPRRLAARLWPQAASAACCTSYLPQKANPSKPIDGLGFCFLSSRKSLKSWESFLLLQLGLKPKGLTLPYVSLTTHPPFTFAVLYYTLMEVCLDWIMLDLRGPLGLAGEAARGVELAGLSPLRQANVVVSRNISGANDKTPLRHVGQGVLVILLDGVLPLGTRRVVALGEQPVLVGVKNKQAVVADTVETVHKPGRQRLVQEPWCTAKRVALCLASSIKIHHPRELYKTLRQ